METIEWALVIGENLDDEITILFRGQTSSVGLTEVEVVLLGLGSAQNNEKLANTISEELALSWQSYLNWLTRGSNSPLATLHGIAFTSRQQLINAMEVKQRVDG